MLKGQINKRLFFVFSFLMFTASCLVFSQVVPVEAAVEGVGRFTHTEGRVDILRGGELPAVPVKKGDQVFVKDIVRTKSDSKAEILFSDGNILRLAQRTRIDISEYTMEGANSKEIIKLPRGKVEAVIEKKAAQRVAISPQANRFEIHTPNAVAGVRGTRFFVFHSIVTGVLVKDGIVYVFNPQFPETVLPVDAGKFTSIADKEPPKKPTPVTEEQIKGHDKEVAPSSTEDSGGKGKAKGNEGQFDTAKQDKVGTEKAAQADIFRQEREGDAKKTEGDTGKTFEGSQKAPVITGFQNDVYNVSTDTKDTGKVAAPSLPGGQQQQPFIPEVTGNPLPPSAPIKALEPSLPGGQQQQPFIPEATGNPLPLLVPTVAVIPDIPTVVIPSVEVGRTTLTGEIVDGAKVDMNYLSISLKDVVFLAPSTGTKPALWFTDNISGSYKFGQHINGNNITGKAITLSNGKGLDANFKFNQFGPNWAANVIGGGNLSGGSYNGPVSFNGTASGTAGGGSFSGIGKGAVK